MKQLGINFRQPTNPQCLVCGANLRGLKDWKHKKFCSPRCSGHEVKDLIGRRYGSLVVISRVPKGDKKIRRWLCVCDCGGTAIVQSFFLRKNQRGCMECSLRNRIKHGHASNNSMTPTYRSWQAMLRRCLSKTDGDFGRYGAIGITVCDRWRDSFENFLADMGERPERTTIDRQNVYGNYEPGNCRWATSSEQARNKRLTKLEHHEPEQIRWLVSTGCSQTEVGRFFGISCGSVSKIVNGYQWRSAP
jgi:hypothetical protein